jgi:predicted small integral membrane protein
MKFDITQLLIVFDELLTPPTDEELGIFWFRVTRSDGLIITLSFSIYECYAGVLIHDSDVSMSSIRMKNCSEIRVLDEKKKCLEILHADGTKRCFLSLLGDTILEYKE